jgi:hypothetical protein
MSALRSDVKSEEEKRRAPRVGVGARAVILLHSTRKTIQVSIRDLSVGGIGITCDQAIAAGEHFSLLLTKADGKSTHILYEVRHSRHAIDGIYDVGARLVEAPANAATQPSASQQATAPQAPPASISSEPSTPAAA